MKETIVFTDGASKGNPGPGGWGVIVADDTVTELGGRQERTTNNRMELVAVIEALRFVSKRSASKVHIYTDSSYVLKGATEWGEVWRKRGWVTAQKEAVLNRDLWEELLGIIDASKNTIVWHLVRGHVAIAGNERVDEIASAYASGGRVVLFSGERSAYTVDMEDVADDSEKSRARVASRERSRLSAYSYVSEIDGVVEVHKTWRECEARVKGRKARFKKALSRQDEAEIVERFSK